MTCFILGKLVWGVAFLRKGDPSLWSPPPCGVLKFNVDGALKGKLGPVGIREVLGNYKGEVLFTFSKNV